VHRIRRSRTTVTVVTAALAVGGSLFGLASPAFAAGSFTTGDLVIYETQGTSSAAQAVDLVDYSTSGTPSGFSVALPIADSGSTHALTESGAALNDGLLTQSADGQSLIATGYDAVPGVASITSAANTPRTVAIVSPSGTVDTSTSITNSTVEANNFRSATTALTGGLIYTGSGGGTGVTTDGTSGNTFLTADKTHEVQVYNGQLYESTTKNIYSVGSGLPTSGTQTTTALLSGANLPANFGPDQFAFATLGSGATQPDTLYVADGSNGATAGEPNAVEKYSLESGVWTATGSITVPLAVGIAVSVSNGVASLYVTGATSASAGNNTVLYGITDSSGFGGTLSGTASTLATAPTGTDFKGLTFAPVTPGSGTPETPYVVLLPVLGITLIGGYVAFRRRYRVA
jgi:hypothetical protein